MGFDTAGQNDSNCPLADPLADPLGCPRSVLDVRLVSFEVSGARIWLISLATMPEVSRVHSSHCSSPPHLILLHFPGPEMPPAAGGGLAS